MSRRARSWTVKLSGDNGEGGDELSLPLLEEVATTTCWEDAMVSGRAMKSVQK